MFALLASAAPAGAAEYTVQTCAGQAAATGGWALFASGPNTALSENCATSGGSMTAVLDGNVARRPANAGWQVYAPANTTIAGATLYRKLAVAGHRLRVRRARHDARRGQLPDVRELHRPGRLQATEIARSSFAWRSPRADVNRLQVYVQCAIAALPERSPAARRPRCAITRADIALTDNAVPTDHRRARRARCSAPARR